MHPTLVDLLANELLTPLEAEELECYVTSDPQTFRTAPRPLLEKATRGMQLLWFDPDELNLMPC